MADKRITRSRAIRLKCLDCCCGQSSEVRFCPSKECPLWRYRMGHEERDEFYGGRKKWGRRSSKWNSECM